MRFCLILPDQSAHAPVRMGDFHASEIDGRRLYVWKGKVWTDSPEDVADYNRTAYTVCRDYDLHRCPILPYVFRAAPPVAAPVPPPPPVGMAAAPVVSQSPSLPIPEPSAPPPAPSPKPQAPVVSTGTLAPPPAKKAPAKKAAKKATKPPPA